MMQHVTVVGSGTMGNGIAHIFALHGYKVAIVDISEEALNKALTTIARNLDRMIRKEKISEEDKIFALNNLDTYTKLRDGTRKAELVVEAASESIDTKLAIFKELDELCDPDAILASNTSSISITKIAGVTRRPDKVIGMHFMNPVPMMDLVEIIRGYNTSDEVTKEIFDTAKRLKKTPVEVHDYPGFVANRILMPMINEAIITLHEGVAGVAEIDTVMRLGMAHRMGPLQLADFIGLDVCLSILTVMHQGLGNSRYAPCPLLVNMVNSGNLGVKTGNGFYKYSDDSKELVVADYFSRN